MSRFVKASALIAVAAAIGDSEWEQFKTQYQKSYANDAEELERYGLFKKSKARVAKLNALNPEPVFGITSMSDRHPEEQFKKGLRMPVDFVPTAPVKQYIPRNSGGVNWGVTEVVTAFKNQASRQHSLIFQILVLAGATGTSSWWLRKKGRLRRESSEGLSFVLREKQEQSKK